MSRDTSSRTRIGVCQQGDLSSSLAQAAWMRASKVRFSSGFRRRISASRGHESGSWAIGWPLRYRNGRALGITRPGTISTSYDGRLDASTLPYASRMTPRVVGRTTRRMMFSCAIVE